MGTRESDDNPAYGYDAAACYVYDESGSYNCDDCHIGFDRETNLHGIVQVRDAGVQPMRTM